MLNWWKFRASSSPSCCCFRWEKVNLFRSDINSICYHSCRLVIIIHTYINLSVFGIVDLVFLLLLVVNWPARPVSCDDHQETQSHSIPNSVGGGENTQQQQQQHHQSKKLKYHDIWYEINESIVLNCSLKVNRDQHVIEKKFFLISFSLRSSSKYTKKLCKKIKRLFGIESTIKWACTCSRSAARRSSRTCVFGPSNSS